MVLVPNPQDVTGVPDKPKGPPAAPVDLKNYPEQGGYVVLPGAPGPTLTAATRVLTAIGVLGVGSWALKVVSDSLNKNTPKRAKTALKRLGTSGTRIKFAIEHELASVFSQLIVTSSPPLARWLHYEAKVMEQATGTIMAMSEWTYEAFNILRHRTMPNAINAKIRPLIRAINRLDPSPLLAQTEWLTAGRYINNALRSMPWGTGTTFETTLRQLANATAHVYQQHFQFVQDVWRPFLSTVFLPLERRVDYIWTDLYRRGRDGIEGLRARLGTLEQRVGKIDLNPSTWVLGALGTGAGLLGLTALMARAAPNLFCRNTTNLTQRVCAADPLALERLLAMTLGFAILLDPKAVLRAGQEVEGLIDGVIRTMADI